MKKYNNKRNKTHILTWLIGEAIFIFIVATASIALYDMYIKIEVNPSQEYITEKVSKEINADSTYNVSEMLENVSKSVVGISKISSNDSGVFSINSEKTLSLGSGIIVSNDGYILTNEHVSGGRYSKCYVSIQGETRKLFRYSCLVR